MPGVLLGLMMYYLLMKLAVNSGKNNELFGVQPCVVWQEPHPEDNFPEEEIATNNKPTVDDFERLMLKELDKLGSRFKRQVQGTLSFEAYCLLLITSAQHSFLAFRIEDRENTLKRNEALASKDKKLHLILIDKSVEMMVDLQDRFF